jgi:hypothetical protein
MTVEEMLHRMSSKELTWWMAYEKHAGPLGDVYQQDMLAHIHEAVQTNTYVEGMQYGDNNPVPKPVQMPRPHEVLRMEREEPLGIEALNSIEL